MAPKQTPTDLSDANMAEQQTIAFRRMLRNRGTHHGRSRGLRAQVIDGAPYVTVGIVAAELGVSREAILNWVTAPKKFTAGMILKYRPIGRERWFEWQSVLDAKTAIERYGRFRDRRP